MVSTDKNNIPSTCLVDACAEGLDTYDADVELKRAGNTDGNGIPGQVSVWVREGHERDGRPRCSSCRDKDASSEQADDDDLLLLGQLQPPDIWYRHQHDEEIRDGVDAPSCEQMGHLVDAGLRRRGQRPVCRRWAVAAISTHVQSPGTVACLSYLHWNMAMKKNNVPSMATIAARTMTTNLYRLLLTETTLYVRDSMDSLVKFVERSNSSCEDKLRRVSTVLVDAWRTCAYHPGHT